MVNTSPQRKQTHSAVRRIVHFSDVHLNLSTATEDFSSLRPRYGSDTPYSLLTSALKYASSVISQPDVLLFTGDHVTHGDNFTNNYIRRVVETNIRMLETYFPTDPTTHKPHHVTAITGNADSNESYAMDTSTPDLTSTAAALSVVAPVWASSLSAADYDLFERRGYLQYDIDDTLTMLTLNTVPYSPSHYPDTSSILDPFDQFAWLDATLRDLRQMSRVAFIAGHIPPIVDSNRTNVMWHEHYIQSYRTIVREYRDIIKAQFFGHVHSLEFRIPPLEDGLTKHPVPPLFTSGALSPKYGNNPSFTVWEYDAETYELLDYTVHSTKWSEGTRFQWTSLFQASSTYNIASLSTPELINLRSRMGTDESSQLREYYWNMKARSFNLPPCDDVACRARTFCTLTWWPTTIAFANCVASAKTHIIGSILPDSSWIPLLSLPQLLVAIVVLVVMFATMRAIVRFARRKFVVANVSSLTTWYSKKPEKKLPKRHGVLPYGPQNEDS